MRSDALATHCAAPVSSHVTDAVSEVLSASTGVLDTLKGRWNTLMASVQSNVEETIQDAASLLPFSNPSLTPRKADTPQPLSQRHGNVAAGDEPLKRQKTEEHAPVGQQPVQQTTHSCVGVAGEKLTWSGAGSLTSACNCMLMLKQVPESSAVWLLNC
jgi:hypothetical protein